MGHRPAPEGLEEEPLLELREAWLGPPQRQLLGTPGTTVETQGSSREVRGDLGLGLGLAVRPSTTPPLD